MKKYITMMEGIKSGLKKIGNFFLDILCIF